MWVPFAERRSLDKSNLQKNRSLYSVNLELINILRRYCSDTKHTIVSTFSGLVEFEGGDARSKDQADVAILENNFLRKEKFLRIVTNNASALKGFNNGVYKVLKEEYGLKDLVLIRSVCHSLQLAASHASNDIIPRSVEYVVRETYNFFQCLQSAQRPKGPWETIKQP